MTKPVIPGPSRDERRQENASPLMDRALHAIIADETDEGRFQQGITLMQLFAGCETFEDVVELVQQFVEFEQEA